MLYTQGPQHAISYIHVHAGVSFVYIYTDISSLLGKYLGGGIVVLNRTFFKISKGIGVNLKTIFQKI